MSDMEQTTTDEANELRGRPRLSEDVLDELEVGVEEGGGFAVDFTKLEMGQSPLQAPEFRPRARPGWHQTTKRDDEIQNGHLLSPQVGYRFIRKQATGINPKTGKQWTRQPVGQEAGERMKQFDHHDAAGRACYIYWMEVPQAVIDADIRAATFRSHMGFKKQAEQIKKWENGLNSSFGRKDQIVSVTEDFEDGREVIHPIASE